MSAPARLVLASASPRRRELLAQLGIEFEVRPSAADETPLEGETPEPMVLRLALAKARVAARPGEIALGADTVVALDGELLGKPADAGAARAMLARLSGRRHEVWTGVALVERSAAGARESARAVSTAVRFRALDGAEIAAYVAGGEPLDKAGAYAIQGGAAAFVESVEGSWSNVVGLPLGVVRDLLARHGRSPADFAGAGPASRRT